MATAKKGTGFGPVPGLSRTRIDKAGVVLRDYWAGRRDVDDEVVQAFQVMIEFRATFQAPLDKTVTGLRSMVCSEWPELKQKDARVPVVQRLKRREQICSKLERMPDSKLSNMGDIGGCRAVLETREMVDGVLRRIKKNWSLLGPPRDTRDEPSARSFGYRAVHVIAVRDGRRIEIQLRDPREHEWALAVERTGQRLGIPLKEGLGPDDLKEYFRMASEGMYLDSIGEPPSREFLERFNAARRQVVPRYFTN
jgi:putative GTP pyrophosphokinase